MIFSELYGAYYNTVAKILTAAVDHPLRKDECREIILGTAFGESNMNIGPALDNEKWQLIHPDGTTPIKNVPTLPLTNLQKRWLKSVSLDPRIRLFGDEFPELNGVEPLFTAEDYCVFDKYGDGDPFEDPEYIEHFRTVLDSIRNNYPLRIVSTNRRGTQTNVVIQPKYLEYSEKDDKFRVIGTGARYANVVNIARIVYCKPYSKPLDLRKDRTRRRIKKTLEFELTDKRNALERVLLHFAHFEKEAEKLAEDRYLVKVSYDSDDETEMLIRVLSFGPMIKVTAPQDFVNQIKNRLVLQKNN